MTYLASLLWWAIERAMRAPDFRMCEWANVTHEDES